jgi:simple sugar transport system permease protein
VSGVLEGFLEATVRTATPLALAALGETITERAGVVNIGLEGIVLAGAFGALLGGLPAPWGVTGSLTMGYAAAILAGAALAGIFALSTLQFRGDQIIAGTAINLLALGLTGALYRTWYGSAGAALDVPLSHPINVPLLAKMPLIGPAFFSQPLTTYLAYGLIPIVWFVGWKTHAGLALRAVGENPDAARAAGISPVRVRWVAIVLGGALGGLSGATLVLEQAGTFAEGISAGRGFIAIAIVVLARWHPVGAGAAALVFGAASALQYLVQAMGWPVPYQLPLAVPYLLTLIVLAAAGARRAARAPAALGRAWDPSA